MHTRDCQKYQEQKARQEPNSLFIIQQETKPAFPNSHGTSTLFHTVTVLHGELNVSDRHSGPNRISDTMVHTQRGTVQENYEAETKTSHKNS